ncbi:DNA utilization protein GntX [Chromobacterium violaceum]|uniref:DNA utilization protein GntX n=1 Tax=Chromobacterium violaceum TaxID=536 RepID=A0A3S5DLZ9_CHRVL|nr:DNA utilization protein GntX [Chromobacterium violaceum]
MRRLPRDAAADAGRTLPALRGTDNRRRGLRPLPTPSSRLRRATRSLPVWLPLNGLIHAYKYGRRLQLAGALCGLLTEFARCQAPKYDFVIPVPLANERLAERGFNQSSELAKAFADTINSRFSDNLCWRKCNTLPQASLGRAERLRNVRHAFGVKRRCDGLSIAIVDDVATSGATLSALSKMMKKQGAKRVDAWVLARAFSPKT